MTTMLQYITSQGVSNVMMSRIKYDSQFLVQTGLAARLEVANNDPQLSNILDKFLQMLLQVVKSLRHIVQLLLIHQNEKNGSFCNRFLSNCRLLKLADVSSKPTVSNCFTAVNQPMAACDIPLPRQRPKREHRLPTGKVSKCRAKKQGERFFVRYQKINVLQFNNIMIIKTIVCVGSLSC